MSCGIKKTPVAELWKLDVFCLPVHSGAVLDPWVCLVMGMGVGALHSKKRGLLSPHASQSCASVILMPRLVPIALSLGETQLSVSVHWLGKSQNWGNLKLANQTHYTRAPNTFPEGPPGSLRMMLSNAPLYLLL